MSATNCPNCGAPYYKLGASCDYCGTPKSYNKLNADSRTTSTLEVFADCVRIAVVSADECAEVMHRGEYSQKLQGS